MGIYTGAYLDNANLNFRVLPKVFFFPTLFDSSFGFECQCSVFGNALGIVRDPCLPSFFLGGKEYMMRFNSLISRSKYKTKGNQQRGEEGSWRSVDWSDF